MLIFFFTEIIKIEEFRPFPKAPPRKTAGRRRLGKSTIYTDSPERESIAAVEIEKMTKIKIKEQRILQRKIKKKPDTNKKTTKKPLPLNNAMP